jgi:hypothetical protein
MEIRRGMRGVGGGSLRLSKAISLWKFGTPFWIGFLNRKLTMVTVQKSFPIELSQLLTPGRVTSTCDRDCFREQFDEFPGLSY